jgi:LmbE family N-acetylglucosaminyl deacetylase
VAQLRLDELRQSCKILGVTHLELLGYHDSGMPEWEYRNRPDAFCNIPQEVVAARITALIERYRPQVVVSYDPMGAYQHPDHVHAARAAAAAADASPIPAKFYEIALRRSGWRKIRDALIAAGESVDEWQESPEDREKMELEEQRITTTVDISDVLALKREALMSHASQIADSWFSKIPAEVAAEVFGQESFVRVFDRTGGPVPETDLFAGLR